MTHPDPRTILVVDDDPMMLRMAHATLSRQGFRVLVARGLDEAIVQCEAEPVTLAIVDYHMPMALGPEVVAALRQLVPGLRILHVTGSTGAVLRGIEGEPLLRKPFTAESLVRSVHAVLDAPA